MALPDEKKIVLVPGDVYPLVVDYVIDGTTAPVDLTGKTVTMKFYAGSTLLFTLASGSGLTISPSIGRVVVALTSTQTTALQNAGSADRRYVLRDDTSEITILRGKVEVFPIT